MNTFSAAGAAVTGARHLRTGRNGQDAVATWVGGGGAAAVVVCDGCSAGASSEVGARLGAQLVIAALAARLARGERPAAVWDAVRAEVTAALDALVDALVGAMPSAMPRAMAGAIPVGMPGDRAAAIRDHFLFTIVAGAAAGGEACVWAIGDGAYRLGAGPLRVLGPFADNQPPYLGYGLLGAPPPAHLEICDIGAAAVTELASGRLVVATDGAAELADLDALLAPPVLAHPDGLRRRLCVLARGSERIDWDARRVVRAPAALQDDAAIAVLAWSR